MSAAPEAPVASPTYREEALKRTSMMAAGVGSTADIGGSSAVEDEPSVDLTDEARANSVPASAAEDANGGALDPGLAGLAGLAASANASGGPPALEYVLTRKAGEHEDDQPGKTG